MDKDHVRSPGRREVAQLESKSENLEGKSLFESSSSSSNSRLLVLVVVLFCYVANGFIMFCSWLGSVDD